MVAITGRDQHATMEFVLILRGTLNKNEHLKRNSALPQQCGETLKKLATVGAIFRAIVRFDEGEFNDAAFEDAYL